MSRNTRVELKEIAENAIAMAAANGISDVRTRVTESRSVKVTYREGLPENVQESSRRGLSLFLYNDGRYTTCSTNDLRKEALVQFISSSATLCNAMAPDIHRQIPAAALYEGRQDLDLKLHDSDIASVTPTERHRIARALEAATLDAAGDRAISCEATSQDVESAVYQLHSNGFSGSAEGTQFWAHVELSIRDEGDRRPSGYAGAGSRRRGGLESEMAIGNRAAKKALARLGAEKIETQKTTMVVENQVVPRLLGHLIRATSGRSLQQKESFLEGRIGDRLGSPLLNVVDNPFIEGGFGSRLFDAEGIAAKPLPIFENGVLRNFFVDTYYAKKLEMDPTTGGSSNIVIPPGTKSLCELIADIDRGILVSGFIGGSANPTTGDFSQGVWGTLIENGTLTQPVAEMNVSGNNNDLWKRLIAVGSDPYPYSTTLTPSLVFEDVQFSGS